MYRGGVREAPGREDVYVIRAMIVDVRHRTLEPTVEVVRSKNSAMSVIPPFLQKRPRLILGRVDGLQTMRTDR